jgi:hypothetical protein
MMPEDAGGCQRAEDAPLPVWVCGTDWVRFDLLSALKVQLKIIRHEMHQDFFGIERNRPLPQNIAGQAILAINHAEC